MKTYHIHIQGQVQGVGFRPFVYKLALNYNLKGWVNNTVDGVHVEFNADAKTADRFYKEVCSEAPGLAIITSHTIENIAFKTFEKFEIVESGESGEANLLVSPDFALCDDCRKELKEKKNRRFQYPFITCTNCGPRYAIIKSLPYDRVATTMEPFKMCPACKREYDDPLNRRYYSQTNSCPDCTILMTLWDEQARLVEDKQEGIVEKSTALLSAGKILAVKGIGGYLLLADATKPEVVNLLRMRKHRPTKPFALLFPNIEEVEKMAELSQAEKAALQSSASPILLLEMKEKRRLNLAVNEIAPGLDQLGIMIPYAPILEQISESINRPLIATSGNLSQSPIEFQDNSALANLSGIADYILSNNREIVVPQDDSVVRYSPFLSQRIVLRRSRGYAPTFIQANIRFPEHTILAMGGLLKSSFTFLHQRNCYVSQYLGDLESFQTQENYRMVVNHFCELFTTTPAEIFTDSHPAYFSTLLGQEFSRKWNIPHRKIQHHKAHFAAVIAENNLLESSDSVLGVIWDGTGLGDDGQVWGGEFFSYSTAGIDRIGQLEYFDHILGDKMPREPRISALAAAKGVPLADSILRSKFLKTEWQLYSKLMDIGSEIRTSSMGRLFDAVASLLDFKDRQSFEGEAAMLLENAAKQYFKQNGLGFSESYLLGIPIINQIPIKQLMKEIILDIEEGKTKRYIAAKFHFTLCYCIREFASYHGFRHIAFSGGVFQNAVLIDLIIHHLSMQFQLYFHKQLSPNDENISFGQVIYSEMEKR